MQNELVAELFSKYQALKRGEVYVNGDESLVCKYELPLLRQYWCSDGRVPDRKLWRVRRVMENILEKM